MKIRTVKTASGKIAVQAVRYEGKRTVVLKHIGSAKNNEEVCLLKQLAQQWITQFTGQESLFPLEEAKRDTLLGKHEKIFLDLCLMRAVTNKEFSPLKTSGRTALPKACAFRRNYRSTRFKEKLWRKIFFAFKRACLSRTFGP